MTSLETAKNIVKILDNKKAMDIDLIQTQELTIVSDYFIIANGTSNTHVRALADEVEEEMRHIMETEYVGEDKEFVVVLKGAVERHDVAAIDELITTYFDLKM